MNELDTRKQFIDSVGRPMTQSLFLELGYGTEAIYSLKEYDCVHKGKRYPSIKNLYLEMEDPTEYQFATTYFLNWNHWKRICANKQILVHIEEWREELEIKLRSRAVKLNMASAAAGNYQAAKWLADRGWINRPAGRPSKAEIEKEKKIALNAENEYSADVIRLKAVNG